MSNNLVAVFLFILGIIFGSFINALVWRLREQLDDDGNLKQLSKKRQQAVSISKGRSMCPNCKHELAAKDLVPVFSWLFLQGKCRYCHKTISKQYPLVELLTGVLFVISYLQWPVTLNSGLLVLQFITWLGALVGLIALAVYDVKWMLLPNRVLFPLMYGVIASLAVQFSIGRPLSDIVNILLAVAIGGGIFWLLYQVSRGKWIGGGDVKLGALLGLLLGSGQLAFLTLFLASIIGIAWIMPALITKKLTNSSKVPFGPFLIVGAYIAMLWGGRLIDWYSITFLGLS